MTETAPAGAPSERERTGWLPLIEALRAIAAISVVFHHAHDLGDPARFSGAWLLDGFGQWGVLLFFLLSGFLLCDAFWQPIGWRDVGAFYVRRFARIAPGYYVAVGLLFLFFAQHAQLFSTYGAKQTAASATFTHWLWPQYASSLNVDGALWTLSIEMLLYVAMPALALSIGRWPVLATVGWCAIGVGWRLITARAGGSILHFYRLDTGGPGPGIAHLYIERQFPGFLCIFALGIALRRAMVAGPLRDFASSPVSAPRLWKLLALLLPSVLALKLADRGASWEHWIWFVGFDIGLSLLMLPVLAYASRSVTAPLTAPLRAATWLGERSYSIYLWHFPVLLSVFGVGTVGAPPQHDHLVGRLLLAGALTLAVASLSYAAVERPAQQWGRRLAKRIATRRAGRSGAAPSVAVKLGGAADLAKAEDELR